MSPLAPLPQQTPPTDEAGSSKTTTNHHASQKQALSDSNNHRNAKTEWRSLLSVVNLLWLMFATWAVVVVRPKTIDQLTSSLEEGESSSSVGSLVIVAILLIAIVVSSREEEKEQQQQTAKTTTLWRRNVSSGNVMVCAVFPALLHALRLYNHNNTPTCLASISSACLALMMTTTVQGCSGKKKKKNDWIFGVDNRTSWALPLSGLLAAILWATTATTRITEGGYCCAYTAVFWMLFRCVGSMGESMHQVWTRGEWALATSLMSLLAVHHGMTTFFLNNNERSMQLQQQEQEQELVYVVARSGFLGAVAVCPLVNHLVPRTGSATTMTTAAATATASNRVWWRVALSVVLILGIVEGHLLWLRGGVDTFPVPLLCLTWLARFLSQREQEEDVILSSHDATSFSSLWPRYYWLLYWMAVLVVTLQWLPNIFVRLFPTHQQQQKQRRQSNGSSSINKDDDDDGDDDACWRVVLTRKWFHLIALLVFGPATMCAPQLMALSYAIALSILVLVEGLQVRQDVPSFQSFFQAFADPRKNEVTTANNDKDKNNKVIVSHIGLIAGCAMPLFVALHLFEGGEDRDNDNNGGALLSPLLLFRRQSLSMVGIVALGVGDAVAAVVGTLYSRWKQQQSHLHRASTTIKQLEDWTGLSQWGRCNRTWIGSLSMLLSMYACVWVWVVCIVGPEVPGEESGPVTSRLLRSWWPALVWMTIVEAYTSQLDNLVLPLVGVVALLQSSPLVA